MDTYTVILDVQVSYQSIELRTGNSSIVILCRQDRDKHETYNDFLVAVTHSLE